MAEEETTEEVASEETTEATPAIEQDTLDLVGAVESVAKERGDVAEPETQEDGKDVEGTPSNESQPPEPSVEDTPSTQGPAISDALVDRASKYDLTKEDLAAWGDRAEEMVNRFAARFDSVIAQQVGQKQEETAPAKQEEGKKEVEPQQQGEIDLPDALKEQLAEDEIEPGDGTYKAFSQMYQELHSQREAVGQMLQHMETQQQSAQSAKVEADFKAADDYFNSLGDEYKNLWGGGSVFEVAQDSPHFGFAKDLLQAMNAVELGYYNNGVKLNARDVAEKAMNMVAFGNSKEIARGEILSGLEKRQRSYLTPPTSAEGPADPGPQTDAEAMPGFIEEMRNHGVGAFAKR